MVADEQIGGDAGKLPPREYEQEVRPEDDDEQRGDEQRERGEVALQAPAVFQIRDRVQRDERRHAGDRERDREHPAVDREREVGAADREPRTDVGLEARMLPQRRDHRRGRTEGQRERDGRRDPERPAPETAAGERHGDRGGPTPTTRPATLVRTIEPNAPDAKRIAPRARYAAVVIACRLAEPSASR